MPIDVFDTPDSQISLVSPMIERNGLNKDSMSAELSESEKRKLIYAVSQHMLYGKKQY